MFTTVGIAAVLAVLTFARFGRAEALRTSLYNAATIGRWGYINFPDFDFEQFYTVDRLTAAFGILLWVTSVAVLAFSIFVMVKCSANIILRNVSSPPVLLKSVPSQLIHRLTSPPFSSWSLVFSSSSATPGTSRMMLHGSFPNGSPLSTPLLSTASWMLGSRLSFLSSSSLLVAGSREDCGQPSSHG